MAATLGELVQLRDEASEFDAGDEETTTVTVGDGASLRVTLVWTDRPGSTLQYDLDLIVRTADGQERHRNVSLTQRILIATIMSSKSSGKTCPQEMLILSFVHTA